MAEIERRTPQEVVQQSGPLSEMLERFPVEELDSVEMEVYTNAKAHVEELESIASNKGIEIGQTSKESENQRYRVDLAVGVYLSGSKKGESTGDVVVRIYDSKMKNPVKDNARVVVWQRQIDKGSSERKYARTIKKANKFAEKLNKMREV